MTGKENSGGSGPGPAILKLVDVAVGDLHNPDRIVLENVSWTVAAGDYWVVGGLHASGKTNLMATLVGIMPPLQGEYLVFGHNLASRADQERAAVWQRLGMVFDGGRLLHRLTVAENVALPLRYHQNVRMDEVVAQVQVLLEATGLESFASRSAGAIGRNWQQRAGLARALALNPEVLLLDNALTGLDPRDAFWWLEFLDRLARGEAVPGQKPMTLVATADDLRPWRDRARQFAVLKERRFVALGDQSGLATHTEPLLRDLLPAFSR
jgi:ABC-type transporter Mla maintaining outer membrane lipid asymmetry ATPase subunit MlaF